MKKTTITLILLICLCSLGAKTTVSQNVEKINLLHQLSTLNREDTTRLGIYLRLIQISQDINVKSYYCDKLLENAKRLNNAKYECEAYIRHMSIGYNQYNIERVNHWMSQLEPLATKEKLYDYLFLGRRCIIDMMMINGEYEREIKEAQKMLQEAKALNNKTGIISGYHCLSNIYRNTYRIPEAINMLQEAYNISYPTDMWSTIEINNALMSSYQSIADYKNQFKWTVKLDNYLQEQIAQKPSLETELRGWRSMVAISYINYYTDIDKLQDAAKYMQIAEKYKMDDNSIHRYYHHMACYNYFSTAGMYEEALKETDILADIYKELSPLTYSTMIFLKARILRDLNRYDEALNSYKQAFYISDSVNIAYLNKQTDQLKKDYNTEQLQLEKEKIKRSIQLSYLGLIVILTVIFCLFAIHAFRVRKGLKKSEREMRKMAEEMELANVAKETFLSTISTEISTPLNAVVKGALQLTTDEVTDEDERKKISKELNKTSAELMTLINNILNLSRLEAGMMKFKIEDIELSSFIQEFIRMEIFRGKKIDAKIPETTINLTVSMDIGRLQEVFNNIFSSQDNSMQVIMEVNESQKKIVLKISGSPLSARQEQSRDIAMANEINRLTIEHFKGRYEVNADSHIITMSIPFI